MARLNETDQTAPAGTRLSLLPETADAVTCSLDWLREAALTPEGLGEAFDLIMTTVRERDHLAEESQAHNAQVSELIAERDQLNFELLQALRLQATPRESTPQPAAAALKTTKILDLLMLTDRKNLTFNGWLSKIKNKLKVNANYFANKDTKIAYI